MKEFHITNNKGEHFVVTNTHEYNVYKVVNNQYVPAQKEEIEFVLGELNKILKSYKETLDIIKQMIASGQIKDYNSLKQYIDTTSLSDAEKENLLQEGLGELQIADIISLKDKIINQIRNYNNDNMTTLVEFQVHNNSFGEKYCEIKLSFADEFSKIEHLKEVMTYNKTLQKELIDPIILELALKSPITAKNLIRTSNAIENRGDFFVNTQDKANVVLKNGDYDHLEQLNEKLDLLKNKPSIQDDEQRNEAVNEIEQENNIINGKNTTEVDGVIYNELGEIIGYIDNKENLNRTQGKARMRKKAGYSNVLTILAITSMISSLFIILQIFLLSR